MFQNFDAMKIINRLFPMAVLAVLAMAGCSDADNEAPVISDLFITPQPALGLACGQEDPCVIQLFTGDSLIIAFTVTDNEELSQYKFDIHQNFDCHGHAKLEETTVWEVIEIGELTGTEMQVSRVLQVPDTATAGIYHFTVQVADFFGNSVKTQIFNIALRNLEDTVPPVLTVSEPIVDTLRITLTDTLVNDSIRFVGSITDNRALETGGNGKLELRYWQVGSPNVFQLYSALFVAGTGNSYMFDFKINIPSTLVAGVYIIDFRAFDGVNNASDVLQIPVTIE